MENFNEDLVQVAVPRAHLMAVYGLLAQLTADTTDPESPAAGAEDDEQPTEETWSVEDLRRFAATPIITSVTIGKVLDVLAEQPGSFLSTSELEEFTGVPRSNLKGAFSALTRHINKHYDGRGWMLTFKWGPHINPGYIAEGHYSLSQEQADRWKEARQAA